MDATTTTTSPLPLPLLPAATPWRPREPVSPDAAAPGSLRAVLETAAARRRKAEADQSRAVDAAARSHLTLEIERAAALSAARKAGIAAVDEIAEAGSPARVWRALGEALAHAAAVARVRSARPDLRVQCAAHEAARRGGSKAEVAGLCARIAREAGVPRRAATLAAAREAVDALAQLRALRSRRRDLGGGDVVALHARLAAGTTTLPRATRDALAAFRRVVERAFRWPSNAAQSGADCAALVGAAGRVRQTTMRAWTKYSSRESHQATTTDVTVTVTPRLLARPHLWLVDGVVSVDLREVARDAEVVVLEGVFARQGRGVEIVEEKGFLAVAGAAAVHGTTARGARAALSRRLGEARAVALTPERAAGASTGS